MKGIESYAENNWSEIPQKQGVYYFYLNNITFLKCGLYKNQSPSRDTLLTAKKQLTKKLQDLVAILRSSNLSGVLNETHKAPHLTSNFNVQISESYFWDIQKIVNDISLNAIPELISFIEETFVFNTPLYVGKTTKQTLKERYHQHRNDYHNKSPGTFGGRLSQLGVSWDDLRFVVYPLSTSVSDERNLISAIEKYIHSTSNPLLSER